MIRIVIFCIIFLSRGVISFYPNRLGGVDIGDETLTHQDITEIGILRAVASFFEANPRNDSDIRPGDLTKMTDITARKLFQKYYGEGRSRKRICIAQCGHPDPEITMTPILETFSDDVSEIRLQETINDIVAANNLVDRNHHNKAVWHCNGETIREANEMMINLREQVISLLQQENANFDLARERIGQFLHILQMFYSNTNWVEKKRSIAYYSLGIRDKPLYGQAPLPMDTCISCGETLDKSCEDDSLINDMILTSGYKSGQDVLKPYKHPSKFESGKCSHGGQDDDTSRTIAALGGINKDSTRFVLSPHNHLHLEAAQAAINHTTFFFDDKEYGIRFIIDAEKYQQLFQLKSGRSLVFTIDNTGSMSEDIEAVKEVVSDITSSSIGTANEPSNYVVSLFNDPDTLNTVFQTDDAYEALKYLRDIRVRGGGDCPETAMDGLIKALTVCSPKSKLYFFTDASAKDADRSQSVLSLALLKNVRMEFLLTGDCDRKRRSTREDSHRQRRSADGEDLYRSLAAASGGSVYVTDKSGIADVAEIIKESVTTSSVTIIKQTVPESSPFNQTIPIDETVRQVTIKIITSNRQASDHLLHYTGETETPSNFSVTDLGPGIKVIKIQSPSAGIWRLVRQDSNPWEVEVTAQSTLAITTTFISKDAVTGYVFEINGRPIAGENATLLINLPSSELIGSVDSVLLLDYQGLELARHDKLTRITSRADSHIYRSTFPLPLEGFHVAISATDNSGNKVLRLQTRKIVPVNIDLRILPLNESLYINENITIVFIVVNKGNDESNVTVTIKDDQGFVLPPTDLTFTLQPTNNATGEFHLQAGSTIGVTTTVTVIATTSAANGDSFQYAVIRLSTEERIIREVDDSIPMCNITSVTGQCDVTMLDPCTCSQFKWSATAEIGDEGFGLYQVSASIKGAGSFLHDTFKQGHSMENGTIIATIKSDCCSALSYITVVDLASNTGQCVFDLAPGLDKPLYQCKPPENMNFFDSLANRVIVGVVVAVVVVVILVVVVVVVIRKKKTKSVE